MNDSVKVFKACRDLWEEIKRIIREAGGVLTDIMAEGLRAIPIVGITLMGLLTFELPKTGHKFMT